MQNTDNQTVQPNGRRRGPHRGFTLPELLTVVAIISLTMLIAAPSLRNFDEKHALRAKTSGIQSLLHLARSEAISSRTFVAVELYLQAYPSPDSVRLISDATWNAALLRWEGTDVVGIDAYQVDAPHDVQEIQVGGTSYFTGQHYIVFSPTGACGFDDASDSASTFELIIVRMDSA